MILKFQKYSNNGFSLISVMVAASLMGGLALGLMNLTKMQATSTKRAENSGDIVLMTSAIG